MTLPLRRLYLRLSKVQRYFDADKDLIFTSFFVIFYVRYRLPKVIL